MITSTPPTQTQTLEWVEPEKNKMPLPLALPARFFVKPEEAKRVAEIIVGMGFERRDTEITMADGKTKVQMTEFFIPGHDAGEIIPGTGLQRLRQLLESLECSQSWQ